MLKVTGLDRRHTSLFARLLPVEDREFVKVSATTISFDMDDPVEYVEQFLDESESRWAALDGEYWHARLASLSGLRYQTVLLMRVRRRVLEALGYVRQPQPSPIRAEPEQVEQVQAAPKPAQTKPEPVPLVASLDYSGLRDMEAMQERDSRAQTAGYRDWVHLIQSTISMTAREVAEMTGFTFTTISEWRRRLYDESHAFGKDLKRLRAIRREENRQRPAPAVCFACPESASFQVDTGTDVIDLCTEHFYKLPGNKLNGAQMDRALGASLRPGNERRINPR